jgi:serine phosphatase RsbU (regulator of sigma subunit)
MLKFMMALAHAFWPELETQPIERRISSLGDLTGAVFGLPLALAGLVWLAAASDLTTLFRSPGLTLLIVLLMLLFERFPYFIVVEMGKGQYSDMSGSWDKVIIWMGVFLLGPAVLWISIIDNLIHLVNGWIKFPQPHVRWNMLRNSAINLFTGSATFLASLALYQFLGGQTPLNRFDLPVILLSLLAVLIQITLEQSIWTFFLAYLRQIEKYLDNPHPAMTGASRQYLLYAIMLPNLAVPFGLLAAGLYTLYGLTLFLYFMAGLLLASILVNRMSSSAERLRQQSRQMELLDQMSRALLNAPPDQPDLPRLLEETVPSMFVHTNIEIRLYPEQRLFNTPVDFFASSSVWEWSRPITQPVAYQNLKDLPWKGVSNEEKDWLFVPILDNRTHQPLGGIYFAQRERWYTMNVAVQELTLPALQSLASAIASALQRAQAYTESLALERARQELTIAGSIQQSFLPAELPQIPGWQLSAALLPAREASGDFYDVFPLPQGRVGLIVADVADKGMGAALYMALSRTLLRTYALEIPDHPAQVFEAANRRILADTRADQFVTVFYGVLDPASGRLCYSNAGHNPPLLASPTAGAPLQKLIRTGIPLGIQEDHPWSEQEIQLQAGQLLVLYTDGVTDAQNEKRQFFGSDRLETLLTAHPGLTAAEFQALLLQQVADFTGTGSPFDDITLLVVKSTG